MESGSKCEGGSDDNKAIERGRIDKYERAIEHWDMVFPRSRQILDSIEIKEENKMMAQEDAIDQNAEHPESVCVYPPGASELRQLRVAAIQFLTLGLEKRHKWGDVWLKAPYCFGLITDPFYGSVATAVFLKLAATPACVVAHINTGYAYDPEDVKQKGGGLFTSYEDVCRSQRVYFTLVGRVGHEVRGLHCRANPFGT